MTRRRSSATWLAAAYAALVVYASLYPFVPWNWPPGLGWPNLIYLPWPRYWGRFDVWANAVGYFPLGLLLAVALARSAVRHWAAYVLAALGLCLLSLSMEVLQHALPRRVPSSADWVLNCTGAALGMVVGCSVARLGWLAPWEGWRERWFVPDSAGALALVALWPLALLFPTAVPLGVGYLLPRLQPLVVLALQDTPWALASAGEAALEAVPLAWPPELELLTTALGLLSPCLLVLSVARRGWRRGLLVAVLMGLGLGGLLAAALFNFGPEHAWAWVTPTVWPGFALGGALALVAACLSRRACAAWGLVSLSALIALVSQAPADPFLRQTMQAWEQGRFVNMYGLAQWLGLCWPFAALTWLMWGVTQAESRAQTASRP
ncbi:VanZ family protein [Roseateles sp. BYS180W]|uniref:VanZ family protein n=1 Tax=Roseateles rivi TaxID=3299028 RepID=A0ABW7FUN1_9BURK